MLIKIQEGLFKKNYIKEKSFPLKRPSLTPNLKLVIIIIFLFFESQVHVLMKSFWFLLTQSCLFIFQSRDSK